jgi:sugar/nucleoside kinase (ribokinase family)
MRRISTVSKRVLIVGSVALDDVKTPHAHHKKVLGGSASYGSIAASRFAPVDIVGVVGDDFPSEYLAQLEACGVNTRGIEMVGGGKTFHWGGEYSGEMNEATTHFTDLGVFEHFNPTIPGSYQENDFVFLANIHPALQLRVLEQVKKPQLSICDSMNLWINIERETLLEVLKRVDVALLNDQEAMMLFDTHSLPTAAQHLLDLGLWRAIIKKGSHGAQMFSPEGTFAVPAFPLENVMDPTGAGDTFAGGLIGFLASREILDEMSFRQAIMVGSACASFVVEDFSVLKTVKMTKDKVWARYEKLQAALQVDPIDFE